MQRLNFFCKNAIGRGTELSGNFYSSRKKKNFFLRSSEVRFSLSLPRFENIIPKIFGFGNSKGKRYRKMLSLQ